MASGIYMIENTQNGHLYIGSSMNIEKRLDTHQRELHEGRHCNAYLQAAWNKYGEDVFKGSTLRICEPGQCIQMEQEFIDGLRPEYNISPTARSPLGVKHTQEARANMSKGQSGKKLSEETRAKISGAVREIMSLPEIRAKRSAALMGHVVSPETREKISVKMKGIQNALGTKHTPEARANMSAALRGNKNALKKRPDAEEEELRNA